MAIGGSRGKTTVSWMLDSILQHANVRVGSWLSSGVHVNGELQSGELGPWTRVVNDARSGALDIVLQEMEAATVVAAGLPPRSYPLAVITTLCGNSDACQVAPETQREKLAIRALIEAVRADGLIVTNADDSFVYEAVGACGVRSLCFALHRDNPALQRELAQGKTAVWIEDGTIVYGTLGNFEPLVAVHEIPATLDGAMLVQEQNALAACAAALALDVPHVAIRAALRTFTPDPVRQPAACNVLRYNSGTIVVDAPGQIWSLRMLTRGIRHQPRRRTMVVSGSFPRMRLEDLRDAGRILGQLGAIVLAHDEHGDGERSQALKEGMASVPLPPVILTLPDERSAIEHLLNSLGADDVGLILADEPERVLAQLWPAPAISILRRARRSTVKKSEA